MRVGHSLKAIIALVFVTSSLAAGYQTTLTRVTLVVDGRAQQLRTHQDTVAALLMDTGLTLRPGEDLISPALETSLEPGLVVEVRRARPVHISADGHNMVLQTHALSLDEVLHEAQLSLMGYDEAEVEGEFLSPSPGAADIDPIHITVHRAVPFALHEDGEVTTLYTTAPTVGEALRRAGLTLYIADGVQPGLGERMRAGLSITIDRSIPVAVQVDGRTLRARTHRENVGDVLSDLGVVLAGQD